MAEDLAARALLVTPPWVTLLPTLSNGGEETSDLAPGQSIPLPEASALTQLTPRTPH